MSLRLYDQPLAAPGLRSFRYRGAYGFVMIGARDEQDALREAARSLCYGSAAPERLDAWDEQEGRYKPVEQEA